MDEDKIKSIIKTAFEEGEQWGMTHYTWFTPTQEQVDERIKNTIESIFNVYGLNSK